MAEQITIIVSKEVYDQIENQAQKKQKAVAELVNDLVVTVYAPKKMPVNGARAQMLKEIEAFNRLHPTLEKEHLGKFVAIFQEELIDVDSDKDALFSRIQSQYPEKVVLQRQVLREPNPKLNMRSPKIIE